ncbi:MAG: beta-phosphoglucomutase, partial [Cyanobacteria bacterium P01_F01_bin.42]
IAAQMRGSDDQNISQSKVSSFNVPGYPTIHFCRQIEVGQEFKVEKIVSLFTSRDTESGTPLEKAQAHLHDQDFDTLKTAHQRKWKSVWHHSDVVIDGDQSSQLAVRFNLYQLLICGPPSDQRVSIAAKTLSGFGYRGHVFWDTEIFIVPFFNFTQPHIARNLLTYRYLTLEGARRKAKHYGYRGAMYAWESAISGDEVTPRWVALTQPYAQDVRIWCRDLEVHISADIAYAIWHYWQSSGDDAWVRDFGAEIILDTAIFWMSRVEFDAITQRYEIRNVIGADEYHEHVANNVFTNRLVQWHLEKAILIDGWLRENYPEKSRALRAQLNITERTLADWQEVIRHIVIYYDAETHLIEQFEGFFKLEDINLQSYEPRTQSMQTILGIEGANAHQVLKQPDVLMLLYLMRESQEFPYGPEALRANWDYYLPRTDVTYGSSLGPAIHAILASDLDETEDAYHHFRQAAFVDLEDLRGNAAQGIHGASAGGVWQSTVFGFGGIKFTPSGPVAEPHLPKEWMRLSFKINWRGQWHCFDIRQAADADAPVVNHRVDKKSAPPLATPAEDRFQITGVIFDLDGVITDTAEYHYRAWLALAEEEGLHFNRAVNESLRGIPRRESLIKILGDRQVPEEQLQSMMARKNELYVRSLQNITPDDLLPGSREFLEEVKAAGIRVALGSASKNARAVLDKLGLADDFDVIADGYSVKRSKPAPDLFLFAARRLGTLPHQTIVLEDASAGVDAALAANMWTLGLGPRERVGKAHLSYPSLHQIGWKSVFESLFALYQSSDASNVPAASADAVV